MTETFDKSKLFEERLDQHEITVEGLGTFKIRSLSRWQALLVGDVEGTPAKEAKILRFGIVEPSLTEQEIARWQKASPAGEIEEITEAITKLSGMQEGAEKAEVERFP